MGDKPLLAGLLCVVFGVLGSVRIWTTYTQETAIAHDGSRAEGRVTRKWVRRNDETAEDYMLGYSFALPSGRTLEAEHEVPLARYRALQQGDALTVLYARNDPRSSFPEGAGATSRRAALLGAAISGLVALLGVGMLGSRWLGRGRGA